MNNAVFPYCLLQTFSSGHIRLMKIVIDIAWDHFLLSQNTYYDGNNVSAGLKQ